MKLVKNFKKEHKEIFDIAIYGSAIRNKIAFRDIDIAIIFLQPEKLEKKLTLSQELKEKFKKIVDHDIDIKGIDIKDLFNGSFGARKAIISEGFLILRKKFLHEIFGFKNFYIFSYSLKNLTNSKKVMFQYALYGRRSEKGLVDITNSIPIGRGAIMVPFQHSEEFKEFFEKNKINYKTYFGLIY